jgi:lysozyme
MTAVTVNLNEDQYSALCNIVFDIGAANFKNSTLLQVVNEEQFDRLPSQFRRWVNAGGRKLPGFVWRRNNEIALFFSGTAIPRSVPIPGEDLFPLDIYSGIAAQRLLSGPPI